MENVNESAQEAERSPSQYAPPVIPRKELRDSRYKYPILATVLSLMPGLGQIYVGYYQQGFINVVVVAGLITLLNSSGARFLTPFLAFFLAFYWMYNMVDAYRKAAFYNHAMVGLRKFELPEGEQLPGTHGSLFGGGVLIVAGVIALAYTRFGLPLEWIARWWPVALILFGAYLLYQSVSYRKRQQNKSL